MLRRLGEFVGVENNWLEQFGVVHLLFRKHNGNTWLPTCNGFWNLKKTVHPRTNRSQIPGFPSKRFI